ncbi:MAG: DUF5678 domain-containing protein [Chloroflexota bacterium]
MSVTHDTDTASTADPALDPNFGREEMAWLAAHDAELQAAHAGKWIAVDGSELVAVADDLETLLDRSRAVGHPDPFVTAVPLDPAELLYF